MFVNILVCGLTELILRIMPVNQSANVSYTPPQLVKHITKELAKITKELANITKELAKIINTFRFKELLI